MAWQFAAGEILTAANLNAVTVPWNAICHVTRTANQNIADSTNTQIAWDGQVIDPLNWSPADGVTAGITPTIAGYYQVTGLVDFSARSDFVQVRSFLFKNGASVTSGAQYVNDLYPPAQSVSPNLITTFPILLLNGTTDSVSLSPFQDNTGSATITMTGACTVKLVYPT